MRIGPVKPRLELEAAGFRLEASPAKVVEGERVLAQDPAAGLGRVVCAEQLGQNLGECLAPPLRGEVVELRSARGIRRIEELRDGRELERLADDFRRTRDVRDRQR